MRQNVFDCFEHGVLAMRGKTIRFQDLPWNAHPQFAGVALKHLIRGGDTEDRFSYHLVRIDPGCAIETHIHERQLETHEVIDGKGVCENNGHVCDYAPGTVAVMEAGERHRVAAGDDGLYLFAKFMPALC